MNLYRVGDLCVFRGTVFIVTSDMCGCDCYSRKGHWHVDPGLEQRAAADEWTCDVCIFTPDSEMARLSKIMSRVVDPDDPDD